METGILHCDMNNFYASVECHLNPDLRAFPVAVCGSTEERHGIVLAKNEAAKACGVQTGEVIRDARLKCPELVVVPPHYEEYRKYSRKAAEIYARYTDRVEPYGLDECWLDVRGSRLPGLPSAPAMADSIRRTIRRELGLSISVGVSFNKVFAKLGSDLRKPDAVTVIPRRRFRELLWHLPVQLLFGVGYATQRLLRNYSIRTIGDLAGSDPRLLRLRLGKNGETLWRRANGEDHSVVQRVCDLPPPQSVGHGLTTVADLETEDEVRHLVLLLTQDIEHRLRKAGLCAGGVALSVRDAQLQTQSWQTRCTAPTQSALLIAREARALFSRHYRWRAPVRSLTVQAISLSPADCPQQMELLPEAGRGEQWERVEACMETIRTRFGRRSIRPAALIQSLPIPAVHENGLLPAPPGGGRG